MVCVWHIYHAKFIQFCIFESQPQERTGKNGFLLTNEKSWGKIPFVFSYIFFSCRKKRGLI